jgi:hypothetical protein
MSFLTDISPGNDAETIGEMEIKDAVIIGSDQSVIRDVKPVSDTFLNIRKRCFIDCLVKILTIIRINMCQGTILHVVCSYMYVD